MPTLSPAMWLVLVVTALFMGVRLIGSMLGAPAAEWRKTPYDDLSAFDVFISYKSEDVDVVRAVVDALLAAGVRVWFAEHIVLLTGREDFSRAIRDGIRRSRYAVIFSNDRYSGSPHCRRELAQIFGRTGPGLARSVEVRMPPEPGTHRFHRAVAEARSMVYDGSVAAIVAFIGAAFQLNVARTETPPDPDVPNRAGDRRAGWAVDARGWAPDPRAPVGSGGLAFVRDVNGRRLRLNIHVGRGTVAPRPIVDTLNDREVFDRSIVFAEKFLRVNRRRPIAVHLWIFKRFTHMVVAYWLMRCWARRYSIVLPHPSGGSVEFAFAFGFFGPFAEYCAAVPLMDRLVRSLDWPVLES